MAFPRHRPPSSSLEIDDLIRLLSSLSSRLCGKTNDYYPSRWATDRSASMVETYPGPTLRMRRSPYWSGTRRSHVAHNTHIIPKMEKSHRHGTNHDVSRPPP